MWTKFYAKKKNELKINDIFCDKEIIKSTINEIKTNIECLKQNVENKIITNEENTEIMNKKNGKLMNEFINNIKLEFENKLNVKTHITDKQQFEKTLSQINTKLLELEKDQIKILKQKKNMITTITITTIITIIIIIYHL